MNNKQPLWADLHNHNQIGYGVGSLDRSLRLAQQRLDVWAFTAHAHWDDIPEDWTDADVQKHMAGFRTVADAWPTVVDTLRAAHKPGRFLPIAGFEWHSNRHGDRHVLPPQAPESLPTASAFEALKDFAVQTDALLVPHHLAYPPGARGVNWANVDDTFSPVAEIFSEHGASECDDGPWPMDGHSMSPRSTHNSWQAGLRRGLHLGAVASTDNHFGCPAAYNEGLAGIWGDTLTTPAVFDALRARRCFAVTGDRIALDWACDEVPMGTVHSTPRRATPTIRCTVNGWETIEQIDLLRNGALVHRWSPELRADPDNGSVPGDRYFLRARWGWGRMGSRADFCWEIVTSLEGGTFNEIMPGFGSVPPAEEAAGVAGTDGEFVREGEQQIRWSSRTNRAFPQPFDQMAFQIQGTPRTQIHTVLRCWEGDDCHEQEISISLADLLHASQEIHVTQPPFTPTFQWTRALPTARCAVTIEEAVQLPATRGSAQAWPEECFYVRVRQRNGQMAWSSPVWFPYR